MAKQLRWIVAVLALVLLGGVLVGCGGGDDGGSEEAADESSDDDAEDQSDDVEDQSDDADEGSEDDESDDEDSQDDEDAEDEDSQADEDDGGLEGDREDTFDDFEDDVKDDIGPMEEDSASYGEYTRVVDESGYLAIEVPTIWTDVEPAFGLFGPSIVASTAIQSFYNYEASGLNVQVSSLAPGQTDVEVLRAVTGAERQNCTSTPRDTYEDDVIIATFQVFVDCAGTTTDVIWMAFTTHDFVNHGVLGIGVTSDADFEVFEQALATMELDASA